MDRLEGGEGQVGWGLADKQGRPLKGLTVESAVDSHCSAEFARPVGELTVVGLAFEELKTAPFAHSGKAQDRLDGPD